MTFITTDIADTHMKGRTTHMDYTPDDYTRAVASQLRAERAAAQMSVRELAEASGVTQQSLLRYLNEKRDIPIPVLYQICSGLGVPVHELIRRAERRLGEV